MAKGDPIPGKNGGTLIAGAGAGRKGPISLLPLLREALAEAKPDGRSQAVHVVQAMIDGAIERGDAALLRQIWDRIDGPIVNRLDLTVKSDADLLAEAEALGLAVDVESDSEPV